MPGDFFPAVLSDRLGTLGPFRDGLLGQPRLLFQAISFHPAWTVRLEGLPAARREAPFNPAERRPSGPGSSCPPVVRPEQEGSGGASPSDACCPAGPSGPARHSAAPLCLSTFPQQLGTTVPRGAAAARLRHPCLSLRLRLGPPLPPGGDGWACRCPCDRATAPHPCSETSRPGGAGSWQAPERPKGCAKVAGRGDGHAAPTPSSGAATWLILPVAYACLKD